MSQSLQRSLGERIGHALAFEFIAVSVCAPALAWLMNKSLGHMGALTLMFATIAMLWNMLFNYLFDQAQRRMGFHRGFKARLCHALLFELGLILFFLPYTMGFNWAYDTLRARWFARPLRAGVSEA